jgi:RNA polymerase sigma-70 factor (ECF subfamily)
MNPFIAQLTEMRPTLLRAARRRLRNPDWAEDAVSETLLAALQRQPAFNEPSRIRAWLFGILRHKVVDQLRQQIGAEEFVCVGDAEDAEALDPGEPCPRADPMHHEAARQFILALHRQLGQLPPAHADAFVMRECLDHDTAEICERLAITPNNLGVILHRTRHRLRQSLAAHHA